MSFKEQIKDDSKKTFLNLSEFAEEITYTPGGGAPKVIKAVVIRYELAPNEENVYRSLKKQAEIYIVNDEIEGVTAINKTDDRIIVKDTEGVDHEARINDVISSDEGMWHFLAGW